MAEIPDEFKRKMSEWVELKQQLADVRKDVKVLNQKEKELKQYIGGFMKDQKIDNINLKKGKVTRRITQKKPTFSRKTVENGLNDYFQGDEVRVESAIACIVDHTPVEERDVITLTGIKGKD